VVFQGGFYITSKYRGSVLKMDISFIPFIKNKQFEMFYYTASPSQSQIMTSDGYGY
jgi:hypothetical protein